MSDPAIEARAVHKSYPMGPTRLHVLRGVSFRIARGEFVSIVGASGSGKSTLLHLVGLLDRPDRGKVFLHGVEAETLPAARRNRIRCRDVGFVFQFYHLLPELNVLENVMLPAAVDASLVGWLARGRRDRSRALEIIELLGLTGRLKHKPKELSGGERQRVAIARALMNHPEVLLADEPTGNLDSRTGQQIIDVLKRFNREKNQTMLMVTHDRALAGEGDRVLNLVDGKLQ